MHLRLSAIQDAGLPAALDDARAALENDLNARLRDTDCGCQRCRILIVVFCSQSLPRPPAPTRLTRLDDGTPVLGLHVLLDPDHVVRTRPADLRRLLCTRLAAGLPQRPLRKPAGLDYPRLRQALVACLIDAAGGAA